MTIRPEETEIKGGWVSQGGRMIADSNCSRIESLLENYLREVARDTSGWDVLYVDPVDGRYWELVYLESNLQGGGPPTLRRLSKESARGKYVVDA